MSTSATDPLDKDTEPGTSTGSAGDQMPQPGTKLGHCRIIELIAAGGMANVYKVWQEQLEVMRALKILKPGYSDEAKGRLETEAKISANLRHANIVEIYGMGFWHSIPYIEMEYIDGPSLKDMLEQSGRFPIVFALATVHFMCQALAFAYKQDLTLYGKVYDGLVHRDIKPANILVTSRGILKLADFGIARPSEVSIHTVGSKVMGTFAYLSPEQLNGEPLDHRADIYSLGTVLYEMITGTKTFPQKMLAELVQRKTRGQYIPVEANGIEAPKFLSQIIDKSLALDKNKRYQDMLELDNDVMSVFRKLTARSVEDVVKHYIKNPKEAHNLQKQPKKPMILSPVAVAICILVLLVLTAAGIFINYHNPLLSRPGKKQNTATGLPHPSEQVPLVNTTPDPVPGAVSVPVNDNGTTQRKPAETAKPNHLFRGLQEFTKGNYLASSASLEKAITSPMSHDTIAAAYTRLLQSLVYTGNFRKALQYADKSFAEGLYELTKGELFLKTGKYDQALTALQKAQTTPSLLYPGCQRDAVYLWAKTREAIYERQPNRENRIACFKSWTAYLKVYCTEQDSSLECSTARAKTAIFAK